jgi:hypothetical protein
MSNAPLTILCALAVHTADVGGHGVAREIAPTELALRTKGMWRGYSGSPDPKPSFQQHSDGYWYPRKAFKPICRGSSPEGCIRDHNSWCRAKYWSYRESDDTYQPYHGKRRRCVSPLPELNPADR